MKIAFCTYVSDEFFHSMGGEKLVKSAAHFHPDIPMFCFGTKDIADTKMPFGLLHPVMIKKVMDKGFDAVIYLDADSIIVGKLDEVIKAITDTYTWGQWEIIGVRNNNDKFKAGMDEPIGQPGAGTEDYLNAGFMAVTSKKFIDEWIDANLLYGSLLPFQEQSVFNALKLKYKFVMLDPPTAGVYYGVSALSGEKSHWESWKDIQVINGELFLNNKKVKVLHHGGGFKPDKLGYYMFNEPTRQRLIQICK